MSIVFHNGQLLFVNGILAMDPACCCDGSPCDPFPATIHAHINFCGYSMITLSEWLPGKGTVDGPWKNACEDLCVTTSGDSDRFWMGSGQFGGNASDTATIYIVCRDGILTSLILACGSISECAWCESPELFTPLEWPAGTPITSPKTDSPFGFHRDGAPEQSCPSVCMENWEVLFTGDADNPF